MKTFVINLDHATDRWEHYKDKGCKRWSATNFDEIKVNDPLIPKLISYYNISMKEHLCKIGCIKSHTGLWRYIVQNKLNDILILEDDAHLIDMVPENLPTDGMTYLGGFTCHPKITKGSLKPEFIDGIQELDKTKYRMVMMMSYYIPTWTIAEQMLNHIDSLKRFRAIDIMIHDIPIKNYVSYPASFKERPLQSQIRKDKKKFSNEFYELSKG